MASVLSPPLVPTPLGKARPRSQTLSSTMNGPTPSSSTPSPAALSPSFTRSYQQPVGTGSLRRQWEQRATQGGGGGGSVRGHGRSRSQGDVSARGAHDEGIGKGKRRAVFCDVILDELDVDDRGTCVYPPVAGSFLGTLGSRIRLPDVEGDQQPLIRPMTPGKPPKVDFDRVRQNLHELWVTEESYLRKIRSLHKDYAVPLRSFSRKRETAIIPQFEATHLFINIEQLVPIAEALERDLRQVVEDMRKDRSRLPEGLGEMILSHVERMEPFKKWLANVGASEAIRRDLEQRNSSFREFIERTQVYSRETAQTTGGFKEFLAEPFQRVSRYRLMIDPIIHHLPQDGDDVEPLQAAAGILTEICSMKVDDETRRAAIFWSLRETIDGFPDTMMAYDRQFVDCIDVDEIIEIADSRPTTLRCTLFLFSDTVLIAKRPSGDRSGKQHAGLDDVDKLLDLFQTSHLSPSQANLLGSPKKLRRGVLGFRGLVDISTLVAVDLGPSEFGLVFDHPPTDQSERWCDRPARKYVVANTVQPDVKRAEKEVWLNRFGETVLQSKLRMGAVLAMKSKRIWEDGGACDSTEVYWSVWDRKTWDSLQGSQKGKLALHLDEIGNSTVLSRTPTGRPQTVAHAVFLRDGGCRFEVHSTDASSQSSEVIKVDRIAPAVAAVGTSFGLYAFPSLRPQPASSVRSRSRPRSGLLSAAFDVFGGGTGLRRGNSTTSKGSSAATTTIMTPNLSASTSPRPMSPFVSVSPRPDSTRPARNQPKRPVTKQSAPDLYRRASDQQEVLLDSPMRDVTAASDNEGNASDTPVLDRSLRNNRSLSLPPPSQARLGSPTPSPERSRTSQRFLSVDVEDAAGDPDTSFDLDSTMDASFDPVWPQNLELDAPATSPIAYRPPIVGSTRRRMIGPREMRPPSSADRSGLDSPQPLPFARSRSPSPQRRSFTAPPAMHPEPDLDAPLPPPPVAASDRELSSSLSSSAASKRPRPPLEASPRPAPRKKVAALGDPSSGPRAPSALANQPLFPTGRVPSASTERRIPSGSHIKIRSRRVTSNSSTIRGPPTPPRKESLPDVFSDPSDPLFEEPAVDLDMEEGPNSPIGRLRAHVNELRVKLARETANKENGRIASPSSLSRSPHTRNVFAKSIVGDLSSPAPFATVSDSRFRLQHIDAHGLSKWIRRLDTLVDACEAASARPPSPSEPNSDEGPSALEVEMLEQERDLIAAELAALKEEAASLVEMEVSLQSALEAKEAENVKLLHIYNDMAQEADALLAEFNVALESVTLAAQAEPTATGEYVELTNDLATAVQKRFEVERELRECKRAVERERDEKARLEAILRSHGIAF